eukprot:gi/632977504/ref/XP_007905382.1/ PREDICTED: A-kinase anchor protein 11 [Callorhinchus milii]
MDNRMRSGRSKPRASLKKEMLSHQQQISMRSLLQSKTPLCCVTAGLFWREDENLTLVTFVGLSSVKEDANAAEIQTLTTISPELPSLLSSLQLYSLKNTEIALLTDLKKHSKLKENTAFQHSPSEVVCVVRYPALWSCTDSPVFSMLSKYTIGIKSSLDVHSAQKYQTDVYHTEDDDTNQSVSSIEDDFVTAFEHLEEEEVGTTHGNTGLSPSITKYQRDVASQTFPLQLPACPELLPLCSPTTQASSKSLPPLLTNTVRPEASSFVKSSVTTSSDSRKQRSFYIVCNPSVQRSDVKQEYVPSISPTESEDSECSSPSPIIFLDEEGYQKSLKATLEIPKLPILKDDIEDSDSEVSEFFDSFDQFDELDQILVNTSAKRKVESSSGNPSPKMKFGEKLTSDFTLKRCTTAAAAMNPHKFDHPTLPADVKKPTPRKPESPYKSLSDVPDSPRPMNVSGEESSPLFSPIHSSAFSPLGNSECLGRMDTDSKPRSLGGLFNTYSDYADNISDDILNSVFSYPHPADFESKIDECRHAAQLTSRVGLAKEMTFAETPNSEVPVVISDKQAGSNTLKNGIQRLATEVVEKSIGNAFKDLQKGVSSCTSALYHLATRLTSSVIQMAFQEIGVRRAFSLKESAVNNLANYLVGEAITGAMKELELVKKQIFNNAVARFATDLAEELVFEGIMEVCQFSHPTTPTAATDRSFDVEEKVVYSYATDLSESVLQEAFIELSQVDVTFMTQAAISISLDNIKDVGGETVAQALHNSSEQVSVRERAFFRNPEGHLSRNGMQNTFDDVHLTEKGFTMEKGLLCLSGIVSCISVPLAGKALSCIWNSSDCCQKSYCPRGPSETKPASIELGGSCFMSKTAEEVLRMRYVNQPMGPEWHTPCSGHVSPENIFLCTEASDTDCKPKQGKGEDICAIAAAELPNWEIPSCSFSGEMVDLVVNHSFDLVTPSKLQNTTGDVAAKLNRKILVIPSTSCVSGNKEIPENQFAEVLAETIVNNSVFKVTTMGIKNQEAASHVMYGADLQADALENARGMHQRIGEFEECQEALSVGRLIPCDGRKGAFSQSPDLLRTPPVSPADSTAFKRLTIPRCFAQELKGHLAEEFPPCTPPPSPTITRKNLGTESTEGLGGPELADTLKSLTEQLQSEVSITTPGNPTVEIQEYNQESATLGIGAGLLGKPRIKLNKDNLFSEEDLIGSKRCSSRSPGTPPPTPHQPQHSCHENNIKNFTRQLKGELAKEFLPVTPPSTPRRHSVPCLAQLTQDTEEKAEFVLQLMRSLSEEVLSNDDEDGNFDLFAGKAESYVQHTPTLRAKAKVLEKEELRLGIERSTLQYASQLASSIVSMATEIAAICLEDTGKCDGDTKHFRISPNKLWKSGVRSEFHAKAISPSTLTERELSDEVVNPLWSYAGKVAGEVIRDAKKMIGSIKYKKRKFKDYWQTESNESSYGDQENGGKEKLNVVADQWSHELMESVLHVPQSHNTTGLLSKHSSCESVTDEYAEYIIRMISREGGNGELILDHYANRLACRTVKAGLEQAARRIKQKYKRRLLLSQQFRGENTAKELFKFLTREQNHDPDQSRGSSDQRMIRCDSVDLLRFAESVAQNITYEVTQKLQTTTVAHGLPKSLTDSCLYKRLQLEQMAEDLIKKTWTCSIQPIIQRNKLYHSTGSLNDCGYNCEDMHRSLEHYDGKVVNPAYELNATEAAENNRQKDCLAYAETLSEMVLQSSLTDNGSRCCTNRIQTTGLLNKNTVRSQWHDKYSVKPIVRPRPEHLCQRSPVACQLDIPRIHIDGEQRGYFVDNMISAAIEKAKRELSNTSLAADSGIGHDGISFTESLAAEIITSAMINASQSIISGGLKDGLCSADSATTSQQLSLSVGDDSTGSWSNLSFEDEHPDETSSFLHLSDSNGNSSSWSSLGLEGDIYEENISFPPSDSDGAEDKEEQKEDSEGLMGIIETLLILNVDLDVSSLDAQLRTVLQWIAASQFQLSLVHFKESFENELSHFLAVVRRAKEKDWKVCDLLQEVVKYCEMKEPRGAGAPFIHKPLFDWLLENT